VHAGVQVAQLIG